MEGNVVTLNQRLVGAITSTATGLAYFLGGLSSSFLFWAGLLFGFPVYPVRVGFVSTAIGLVAVAWALHRRFRDRPWMSYSALAFVGGGTISGVGVWLVYLWLLLIISIITSEYP